MKKFDFKEAMPKIIVAILCVFFVVGVIWGGNSIMEMEGTMAPNINKPGVALPQSAAEAVDFVNSAVSNAVLLKPMLSSETDFDIDEDSIEIGGADSLLLPAAKRIRESAVDSFENAFTEIKADYGEGFADKLWIPSLTAGDVKEYELDYTYYRCPSCGEDFDEPAGSCELCGSVRPLEEKYRDEATITLSIPGGAAPVSESSALAKNFHLRSADEIDALISEETKDYFSYDITSLSYDEVKIIATVNRLTGELTRLEYQRKNDISIGAQFIGEYAGIGSVPASFAMKEAVKFSFTWPNLSLSADELSIEKKTTEALEATLTCSDPVNTKVVWASSDSSIAAVDEDGYVTSGKKDGKATVTATMEFMGKTYSDSCEISVKTPVEKLDISKRKLKIGVGETFGLTSEVSPKKATVKTVTWYSTDESVATVDSNGVITAKREGTVDIYALSDDGYYKATCKTEVTK